MRSKSSAVSPRALAWLSRGPAFLTMAMSFVSRPTLLRTPPTFLFKAHADELRHMVDPQSYSIDPAVHPSVARRHLGVQPASSAESAGRRSEERRVGNEGVRPCRFG